MNLIEFGKLFGKSSVAVHYWEKGKRYPRPAIQERLEEMQCEEVGKPS